MCTLTYVPQANGGLITSNRDEMISRNSSLLIQKNIGEMKLLMPVDPQSKGTWIGASKRAIAVLLNGGDTTYNFSEYSDKESRGNLIPWFFESNCNSEFYNSKSLSNFAPFTLVMFIQGKETIINELVWSGEHSEHRIHSADTPQIWSSSTLYSNDIKRIKRQLFLNKIQSEKSNYPPLLKSLHLSSPLGLENGFRIQRDNGLATISLCQIEWDEQRLTFSFHNLLDPAGQVEHKMSL